MKENKLGKLKELKFPNNKTKYAVLFSALGAVILLLIVYIIFSVLYKYKGEPLRPEALPSDFINLGKLTIKWYAIFVLGGTLCVAAYGYLRFLRKVKIDSDTAMTGVIIGIIAGIIGARIYYVIFSLDQFNSFKEMIDMTSGGLAIHGALYGAAIAMWPYSKIRGFKYLETLEIVIPCFLIAQVIGRWGNFFNQEAYGPLVNSLSNPDLVAPLTDGELIAQRETLRHCLVPNFIINQMYLYDIKSGFGYYHPTFFYEGCLNLIGAFLILVSRKHSRKLYIGDGIAFYMIWYGMVRTFIEVLRQDPLIITVFGRDYKVAIITSVLYIIVGLAFFIIRRIKKFHMVSSRAFLYEGGTLWKDGFGPKTKEKKKDEDLKEDQNDGKE